MRTLVAIPGALLEAAHHDRGEQRWRVGTQLQQRDRASDGLGDQQLLNGIALERTPPGQQLVRKHTHRIDVGAMIELRIPGGLLGRHVSRCTERHPDPGHRSLGAVPVQRPGDAEIGDQRALSRGEDVVGLDVAVHDAVVMGVRQGVGDIEQNPAHLVGGECATPLQARPESLAPDIRHGVVRPRGTGGVFDHARGEDRNDVGMLQPGGVLDFGPEARHAQACHEIGRQQLHHHLALQQGLLGHENTGHPPARELPGHPEAVTQRGLQLGAKVGLDWNGNAAGNGRMAKLTRGRGGPPAAQLPYCTVARNEPVSTLPCRLTSIQIR
jgi:hypothetical protein